MAIIFGADSSGNANNWTANNLVNSGSSTAQTVTFTTVGTFSWVPPANVTSVSYLVVGGAGGGGGGDSSSAGAAGGGGGGGGFLTGTLAITPGQSYTVTVGGSGAGGAIAAKGSNGGDSVFGSLTAIGGGAGGSGIYDGFPTRAQGNAGGSGGGTGGCTGGTSGAGGAGTSGQGNNGGGGQSNRAGGGGGGAGSVGVAGANNSSPGGNGGTALFSSLSGSSLGYGAGGGGGGWGTPGTPVGNSSGNNGSGYGGGASGTSGIAGQSGTTNRGGGGGGGGAWNTGTGAAGGTGGEGIVILSYTVDNTASTYDSMVDVPGIPSTSARQDLGGIQRGNYCTLNPLDNGAATSGTPSYATQGNLVFNPRSTNAFDGMRGTMAVRTGKWYYEFAPLTFAVASPTPILQLGWVDTTYNIKASGGDNMGFFSGGVWDSRSNGASYYEYHGSLNSYTYNSGSAFAAGFSLGDICMCAFDADTGKLWFGKNGTWLTTTGVGNPANGANPYFILNTQYEHTPFAGGTFVTASSVFNFGQRPFTYTPPNGFKSLNTTNLPNPVIKVPSTQFDVKPYIGTGSGLTVGTVAKQTSAYQINKSIRFKPSTSTSLSRTPSAAGSQQKWTWSAWIKRSTVGTGARQGLFGVGGTSSSTLFRLGFDTNDGLFVNDTQSSSTILNFTTNTTYISTSAWYHILVAVDTTQTSAANRALIYVNGAQVNSFSAVTFPSQNANTYVNTTQLHEVGRMYNPPTSAYVYLDGYMAETNFIDGQQLTPSSFGTFDANNNWMPKAYTGTYGTNGFYLKGDAPVSTATGAITTTSSNFDSYLKRADSATGWASSSVSLAKYPQNYTFDTYKYQSGSWVVDFSFALPNEPNSNATPAYISFNFTDGTQRMFFGTGGNVPSVNAFTAGQATVSNGRLAWDPVARTLSENTSTYGGSVSVNSTYTGKVLSSIGVYGGYSGSAGTLGYNSLYQNKVFLFGQDSSGNGNTFNTYSLNLDSGSTYDSMLDSPTDTVDSSGNTIGNYATFSNAYSDMSVGSITDAGLSISTYTGNSQKRSPFAVTSGKWYWEITITGGVDPTSGQIGIVDPIKPTTTSVFTGSSTGQVAYYGNGNKYINGAAATSYGASFTTNDVIAVALDMDTANVTFYKNGVSQGAISTSGTLTTAVPMLASGSGSQTTNYAANFGQRAFAYTPPTGFKSLNTKNLKDIGSYNLPDNFGNFVNTPDFIWTKMTSGANDHVIVDTVRGPRLQWYSNGGDAQSASPIQSFIPNGWTMDYSTGSNVKYNQAGSSYVAWAWNRGQTPGFDIVQYAGSGAARTVEHNLGVAPSMMIFKALNTATANNTVYHKNMNADPTTGYLNLNLTGAFNQETAGASRTRWWNNTAPSSTQISLGAGTGSEVNSSGTTYIAYLWAEVPGFSKFGSYTGNGAADGPFVHCGFRPKWIMTKRLDSSGSDWNVTDSVRQINNGANTATLAPNDNRGGSTFDLIVDITSNGFKLRTSSAFNNASGGSYIYAAFAEAPFKYANAR
jgi:hypothetical protein